MYPFSVLLLMIGCLLPAFATPSVTRLGIEDGLPNATIYSMVQDQNGFVWLGTTDAGLFRFDGYHFQSVATMSETEARQALFSDVGALLIDSKQRLWAGLWGQGLSRLNPDGFGLHRFLVDGAEVQALLETEDGLIWVGTTQGLFRIGEDDQPKRIGGPESAVPLMNQRVWKFAKGEAGAVWIGTSEGVHLWLPETGLQPGRPLYDVSTIRRQNEVRALHFANGRLWVGSRFGLLSFDPESWQRRQHLVAGQGSNDFPPIINALYASDDNTLLVGSNEGLFRFDMLAQDFQLFRQQSALLPSLDVRSILLDRSGVLWLGTRDSGLFHTRFARSAFTELRLNSQLNGKNQYDLSVSSIDASQSGGLWFATSERLYRKEQTTKQITSYELPARIHRIGYQNGHTFFATDAGLYRYNQAQDQLEPYLQPFIDFPNAPLVRDMVFLKDGQAWFGLWGQGVVYYNSSTGQSRHYEEPFLQQRNNEVVQAMLPMPDGRLWVGTRFSGLYLLDPELGVLQQLNTANNSWLPSNTIQCIERDGQQRLIVCTNRGTLVWQPGYDSFKVLYASDGLASDHMIGALHHNNRTWLLSAQGLSLISNEFEHPVTFTRSDGLGTTELNAHAISVAPDGTLYLGSLSGITLVEPEYLWVNRRAPSPVVSGLRIDYGDLKPWFGTSDDQTLQMTANQNSLEIYFSAMDFHDISRNQYRFRLKGYDQDWRYSGVRASALYAQLPPGRYTFQLMASNNHGVLSEPVDALLLEILPHWWQLRRYQLLLFAALVTLILLGHSYRLKHIREVNRLLYQSVLEKDKAQQMLETKVAERTKALEQSMQQLSETNSRLKQLNRIKDDFVSTVSHELRTPLTSIRGALSLMKNRVITPEKPKYQELVTTALYSSEHLSRLIDDLLDVQKFADGKMQLAMEEVALPSLIIAAVEGMDEYSRRFDVSIRFESSLKDDKVFADPVRLRQVLDNLLSNAIKFSPAGGQVLLSLQKADNWLQVSVADQGEGIPEHFKERLFEKFSQADASASKKVQGTGLGLVICKNIVEALGGTMGFEANQPQGACFWFRLPAAGAFNPN